MTAGSSSTHTLSPSSGEIHSIKRRAAQGIATLVVRYGLVICINLAGTIVLSRRIGPSLWGAFAISQSAYLIGQEICGRGLASYLIKKDTPPAPDDIRATFALQNLLGLVAMGFILTAARPLAGWYGQGQLYLLLTAAALACYGYALRGVPMALLERSFEYFKVSVLEILETALFYAAAIPLVWMGQVEAGLASAIVLRSWGPALLTFLLKPVRPAFWPNWTGIGKIVDFGFSVAGSNLINIGIYSVPAVFVGKLSGMAELGRAQMAFSLYSNLLFMTAAVVRLNLSAYSRLIEHAGEFAATINQHLQILAAVLVPLIVIFAGFSPAWSSFIFGQKWQGLSGLLLAQAPGYLLASVFWGVLNPALLVSGKHRQVLIWLAGFFVLYAVLTRLLSPALGAMGVAIAFTSAEILFHPLLFWVYGFKRLNCRRIFPEIIMSAVFAGLIWICAQRSLLAGLLCGTLYLIVWCARNWKTLDSASRDFSPHLRGSALNWVVPADR